jgi:membrane carboxypeptidase/penicillin-binding protein
VAETAVREWLADLRERHRRLRGAGLQAALVALDVDTGAVLAHVGGDPAVEAPGLDRARFAKRQPGSAVKPFVLLSAFEPRPGRKPFHPATRVSDEPIVLTVAGGTWEPANFDGRFRGVVDARETLVDSLNVPTVRIARASGFERVAATFRELGLDVPGEAPPSFVLGSIEVTPVQLAAAFTVFATPGVVLEVQPVRRVERPAGRGIERIEPVARRAADPGAAFIVRDCLREAVLRGTGRAAAIEGIVAAGKTGTSSERRDAWFAGHAEGVVAVVWVGLDDGSPLGLTGSEAAAPPWQRFMAQAVPARPGHGVELPPSVVVASVETSTGLLVAEGRSGSRRELFLRKSLPPHRRWWRIDEPEPVVR